MAQTTADHIATIKEGARLTLSRYTQKAIDRLVDAIDSDNEKIALQAAESVLDRVGLGKSQQHEVQVSQVEHEQAKTEAERIFADLKRNAVGQAEDTPQPELEAILVLESESDDLPIAEPTSYQDIMDAEARLVTV